jgi:hypothetical protein
MKRLTLSLIGTLLGCAAGWYVAEWIYPWELVTISTAGPEPVGSLLHLFGLCVGGPLGFLAGTWLALSWIPGKPQPVRVVPPVDPQKIEDNLG